MAHRILKYLCSILIYLASAPFILCLLPIYVLRRFVGSVLILFYPDVDKLLTTRSSIVGWDSLEPNPKSTLSNIMILQGTIPIQQISQLLKSRVIDPKAPNGRFKRPEIQQYVTNFYGFLAWKWETNFDIKNHFRLYEGKYKTQFQNGTKPVNAETICDVGMELGYTAFRPKQSPWEALVIHNYRETDPLTRLPVGPLATVCFFRVHHCLGDGFSLMKTVTDLSGSEKLDTALPNYTQQQAGGSIMYKVGRTMDFIMSAPYDLLSELKSAADVNSWHVPETQLKRVINSALSHQIPLDYFKEIKNFHKVSLTTLLIGCFSAALRKFMIEAGFDVPGSIHCLMPLPVPGHPDKMRNHMYVQFNGHHRTGCFNTLPVGLTDSKERLVAIEENLAHIKRSSLPIAGFHMAPLAGGLLRWMLPHVAKQTLVTAIMSNFPGSNRVLKVDGQEILSMWFGGGFNSGNIGMGFSSLSYNGTIRISAGIDEGIVSRDVLSAKKIIQYFLEEAENLRKEALV